MIKAIIFDLDNTLTHRNQSIEKFTQHFMQTFVDRLNSTEQTVANLIKQVDGGGYGHKDNPHDSIKHSMAARLRSELEWSSLPSEMLLFDYWVSNFPKASVFMPGAESLITQFKEAGYKLAILSNGNHQTRIETIENLGVSNDFDVITSSDHLGIKKPNGEAFSMVATDLGVAADECCFIGDHPSVDINGAEQTGMKAVWLEGFHSWPLDSTPPTFHVKCLDEVFDLVTTMMNQSVR